MGDPKKPKKKFKKPGHPWEADRIKNEVKLMKEYGILNKKEIWKAESKLRNWRRIARRIVSLSEDEQESAKKILITKLHNLGIINKKASIDEVLALDVRDILQRRLQTITYEKGLSNSVKQARQFITHNKIVVNNKVINSPSYLVKEIDEINLKPGFSPIVKKIVKPANTIEKKKTDEQVVEELAQKATEAAK